MLHIQFEDPLKPRQNEGPSDLLTAYRMQHSKPPEQVNIMGGMLSMFFLVGV